MTTTVYWTPIEAATENGDKPYKFAWMNIAAFEPAPVLKFLLEHRGSHEFFQCPAFIDACKNTYVIRAPMDLRIIVDRISNTVASNVANDLWNLYCVNRGTGDRSNNPFLLTLFPEYAFYSHETVIMEVIPPFLSLADVNKKTDIVPGRFDISKWVRHADWTFEIVDDSTPLEVKRGDPLLYIKFTTPNDDKIVLERVQQTKELDSARKACVAVKNAVTKQPLKVLYAMAESYLSTLGFGTKKSKESAICKFSRKIFKK
jgi:hypothetical protein